MVSPDFTFFFLPFLQRPQAPPLIRRPGVSFFQVRASAKRVAGELKRELSIEEAERWKSVAGGDPFLRPGWFLIFVGGFKHKDFDVLLLSKQKEEESRN